MQTTATFPPADAARTARQRHIIDRLTHAILYQALLIFALIAFMLYQNYWYGKPGEASTATLDNAVNPTPSAVVYVPPPGGINGETLFEQKCASCHLTTEENTTGPGLKGASQRVPSREWLHRWVKNPVAMINSGDPYATKIYKQFGPTKMQAVNLSDAEIDAVFEYIDTINK